jgi:hypothetical protein
MTHRPRTDFFAAPCSSSHLSTFANSSSSNHGITLPAANRSSPGRQPPVHALTDSLCSVHSRQLHYKQQPQHSHNRPGADQLPKPSTEAFAKCTCGMDLAGQVLQNQMPSITFDHTVGNIDPNSINNAESNEQHSSEREKQRPEEAVPL